jgi:adenylate cyclase
MLQRILDDRCTMFHVPHCDQDQILSLVNVQSLVAAPILNSCGEVIGGLYGQRRLSSSRRSMPALTELEAKLFEVLACGVASGLARLEQERQLVAERVRFEQFFTPELARMLGSRGEEMLAARDAEITVLFCDIRGFSRISKACGAELAVEWVRDVLSALSDCVADHQGVLVDYSGDSLEALWGAPLAVPDHATLACRAALQMRSKLPELNERWRSRLGEPTDVSIGINSGRAQVGNIGSRRKFKYGAFGTTVNQASRVQGAAKQVGVPLLVTRSTVSLLQGEFALRRLWTVQTVNIDEPVELFELADGTNPDWPKLKTKYEEALAKFEGGQYYEAMTIIGSLVADFSDDEPTRRLLQRIVNALGQPAGTVNSVWILDGK